MQAEQLRSVVARGATGQGSIEAMLDADGRRRVRESHHAYAITVAEGSVVDEAHATLFRGLVVMDTGELERSYETLQRADDLFAEVAGRNDAALWPIVSLGLGEIAARRGLVDEA